MIFWIFIILFSFFALLTVIFLITGVVTLTDEAFGAAVVFFALTTFVSVFMIAPWVGHANDLAKVTTQHYKVEVHQDRIDSLQNRLDNANYPEKSPISLDADSPWATMIVELSKAEGKLADAKEEKAVAIRSIESRKHGPFSGVVWFVGDIPDDVEDK